MTQLVEQLRNQAKWYAQPGHNARDLMDSRLLEKAADEIECLRAKVEAAEKSDAESLAMYRKARDERDALRAAVRHEADCVEAAKAEIKALRAEIEQMEKQAPVVWMQSSHLSSFKNRLCGSQSAYVHCSDHQLHPYFKPLYALPGAQPAPSVPDGWQLVPEEVISLYNYMCAVFVPMTPQQEEIAIQLGAAKRAMLAAAPKPEAKP